MHIINNQDITSTLSLESLKAEPMIIARDRLGFWLKANHKWIEFYLYNIQRYSLECDYILKIFQEIKKIILNNSYAVTHFIPLQSSDRHFPQVNLLSNDLKCTSFIRCPFPSNPTGIRSRDEVNEIVQAFSTIDFSWDALDECDARAEISCRLLKAMGIREEKIKKIWITSRNEDRELYFLSPSNKVIFWRWHIAPLVTTETGENLVIDLFLDKTKALSVKEWSQLIAREEPHDIGEIESDYTCDMLKRKKLLVSEEIFKQFSKRIHAQYFLSRVESGSYTEKFLEAYFKVDRPRLVARPRDPYLHTTEFADEDPVTNSRICTVS